MILAEGNLNVVDLVELQFIDNAITARNSEMEKLKDHAELNGALKKLEDNKAKLAGVQESFHEIDIKRKKLEDTVGTNEEKIKSNEQKLFGGSITDSKELSNYQNEIESLKKNNSNMEDEILELMEKQEEVEPVLDGLKKEIAELEELVKRIKNEIEEKAEVLKHNIEGLKHRREDVISRIPEEGLKKYKDVKSKKGGIPVSVIKDNFCGVCSMEVPHTDMEKMVDSDTLYKCPLCGRLSVLYRPELDDIKKELE
jgi:predicted  nucleic acid-binding Zn-ribbon protein